MNISGLHIVLDPVEVAEFYKYHTQRETLKQFKIGLKRLRRFCKENNIPWRTCVRYGKEQKKEVVDAWIKVGGDVGKFEKVLGLRDPRTAPGLIRRYGLEYIELVPETEGHPLEWPVEHFCRIVRVLGVKFDES